MSRNRPQGTKSPERLVLSWKTLRIPQLHVKWSFDDVLIFRCVPLLENDQNKIWYGELFYPKSHTLAGSVSELSQILGLYIHTYIQGFLKESLTKLVSIGSRLYQRILQFCKYCATRDDLLHIMVSKAFRSAQKLNLFRKSQNRRPQPALRRKLPESQKYPRTPRARARAWEIKNTPPDRNRSAWKLNHDY